MSAFKISPNNLKILCVDEACMLKAYQDSGGIWSIGFGHTHGVKKGDTCTREQAIFWLTQDMDNVENWLNNQKFNINQNQFDSLCDFTYNCGIGHFILWGLPVLIKKNPNDPEIGIEIMKHNHDAHGTVQPGLTRRRQRNINLYFKPV